MGLQAKTLPNYNRPYPGSHQHHKSPYSAYDIDQTPTGRLTVKLQLTGDDFSINGQAKVRKKFLYLDFSGSEIGVGSGYKDRADIRGYFIEKLIYSAWLQRAGDPPDLNRASSNWSIQSESPESANQSGSISSSISYNVNGSGGFFGDTVTGNVGGGVTFSNSYNHTLTDFTFSQRSDARVLRHEIVMSSARDGVPYRVPDDLINAVPNVLNADPQLREVPVQALSNLPIPGQAVWMNDNEAGLAETLTLNLTINTTYRLIEGTAGGGSPLAAGLAVVLNPFGAAAAAGAAMARYQNVQLDGPWSHQIPIDFSLV